MSATLTPLAARSAGSRYAAIAALMLVLLVTRAQGSGSPPSNVVDPHFVASLSLGNPLLYGGGVKIVPLAGGKFLIAQQNLPLQRLNADGSTDPSFSSMVLTDWPLSIVRLASGKLLLPPWSMPLQRLEADGSMDPSFSSTVSANVLDPEPDGHLLAYTLEPNSWDGFPDQLAVQRLNGDGTVDPTFQGDALPGAPVPLADGRLICFSDASGVMTLNRVATDGSLDTTYPATTLLLSNTAPAYNYFWSAKPTWMIDNLGRVYVCLSVGRQSGQETPAAGLLLRLRADGTRDPSFTPRLELGLVSLQATGPYLTYQAQSEEVSHYTGFGQITREFVRLLADGSFDDTFNNHNAMAGFGFTQPIDLIHPEANPVPAGVFEPDGSLILTAFDPADGGIIRYGVDGRRDEGFSARLDQPEKIDQLIELDDGSLLAVGHFTSLNGVPTSGLAHIVPTRDAYATRLVNVSLLANAGVGDQTLMAGFVVGGTQGTRPVLVRGVGPGLVAAGGLDRETVLADPMLSLFAGATAKVANNDWDGVLAPTAAALGAFPLAPGSKDAALLWAVAPGPYSAHVGSAVVGGTGQALIEVYDAGTVPATTDDARLINVSGRAQVGGGDGNVLAAGFVITGQATKRILVRAVGPGLLGQGVSTALPDPTLTLYRRTTLIAENDNWSSSADDAAIFATVGAFSLATDSKDAALIVDLPPGIYSAWVGSADGRSGVAMIEVYEVP